MTPPRIGLASLAIPFRHAFAHASAVRKQSANVLVRLEDGDGLAGLGEGCPRPYVTGETVDGARRFLEQEAGTIVGQAHDLESLKRWLRINADRVDSNPSAICALELALLDLFARREKVSVETLLGVEQLSKPIKATAVYGSSSSVVFNLQRVRFGLAKMTEAKLKLTGNASRDAGRARLLARRGRLRLDANNLFPDAASAIAALRSLAPHTWAVEEPVGPRDWQGMVAIAETCGLALVLDESFTTAADLATAPDGPRWVANCRVSKLGGVLRTLDTIAIARERGLGFIVGAQVGETGILARAGLLAASAIGCGLEGFEAAYGTHLLAYDPVAPTVTFDRRGEISPGAFAGPGWGLSLGPQMSGLYVRA
jgi:L-alanine-DL-glutamate epimerase-like enolase superfamily enzyme